MNKLDLKTLEKFIPQLTHAGNFLSYLNLNELETLEKYLEEIEPAIAVTLKSNSKSKFIFHGSPQKIEKIVPKVSIGGPNKNKDEALIYATTLPDYAIFMGCIKQEKGSRGSVSQQGQYNVKGISVDDVFINEASQLVKGYVYVFSSKDFTVQPNNLSEKNSATKVKKPLGYITLRGLA